MKKIVLSFAVFVALVPSFALANDSEIRSNIVTRLLSIFVEQVNGLEYIRSQVDSAKNPSDFRKFKTLLQDQLDTTTGQIAVLLDPEADVSFGSVPTNNVTTMPESVQTQVPKSITFAGIRSSFEKNTDGNKVTVVVNDLPTKHDLSVDVYQVVQGETSPVKVGSSLVENNREEDCRAKYADGIARCTYTVTFSPAAEGAYYIEVSYNGKSVKSSIGVKSLIDYSTMQF